MNTVLSPEQLKKIIPYIGVNPNDKTDICLSCLLLISNKQDAFTRLELAKAVREIKKNLPECDYDMLYDLAQENEKGACILYAQVCIQAVLKVMEGK